MVPNTESLGEVAHELGFDPGNRSRLLDLTAVGVARLAWRDSPVEDWHAVPYCRIGDGEMMRGNAAVTRLIRDLLDVHLPSVGSAVTEWSAPGSAGGWTGAVHDVIADLYRRLPDGRTLAELAPDGAEFALFDEHVRGLCDAWARRAGEVGLSKVLIVLACHGATFARQWWLSVGWPFVVDEFVRRVDDPDRWHDPAFRAQARLLVARDDPAASRRLRDRLLAGPDRLSAKEAVRCLRATLLDATQWRDCGLAPAPRHVRRAAYFRLVDYPGPVPPPWRLR